MKFFYKVLILLLTSISVFAQAPQKISYQSVIRNSNNVLIINSTVGMKVSVLQGGENGVSVYSEIHTPTTNANGLVSLAIGTGTVVQGVFANIDWSTGSYFVKTEIDPTGGVNYTLIGTSELLSVPFALHAKTASNSGGIAPGTTAGEMLYWNGTAWVAVAPGVRGQNLTLCGDGVPTWGPCPVSLPVVQTVSVSGNGAIMTVNANVISDGGENLTYRGVLFGTYQDLEAYSPYSIEDKVSGNSLGAFTKTKNFWGIGGDNALFFPNSGAINYARAYAINSVGVSYGETVSYTIPTHLNIGDFYQGGYVVYLDQTLQHGLIVSPNDQSTGIAWNDQPDVVTSATGTAVGTGESNTGYILFNQGNGSFAAKLCYDLVEGGYIDWFLPSIDEIRFAIDFLNPLVYDSSSISKDYWTSSEVNISQAKALNAIFTIDGHYYQERTEAKSKLKRVRAMRKF